METTSVLISAKAQTATAVSVATLAVAPPVKASMLDLATWQDTWFPRDAKLAIKGSTTEPATQILSGGFVWGWDRDLDCAVVIAPLNEGLDVTLSATRGFAEPLRDIAACFSHIGITGTLTTGTVTYVVTPLDGTP